MKERSRYTGIASAAAVVLSLIFVGLEVRESGRQTELNTQSLQLTAYQDLISQIAVINLDSMANPELRLLARTASSWDELSRSEKAQLSANYYLITRHGDMAFYQYELGMLTEERMESALAILYPLLCLPQFREWWSENGKSFVESFRHHIDAKASTQPC